MTEPMTLEEAVRAVRDTAEHQHTQAVAFDVILTHAERTIAARSGEPEAVTRLHATDSSDAREVSIYIDTLNLTCGELLEQRDTLTAERDAAREWAEQCQLERDTANDNAQNLLNEWQQLEAERDAARQEFAEWLDASRKALDAHAEVVAELAAAREELDRERMRLAACGVVANANTPQTAAAARAFPDEYRSASCDDVARIVDSEMQLRADRDRLAACVERVRGVCDAIASNVDAECFCGECDDEACIAYRDVCWVRTADILAALEGTDD